MPDKYLPHDERRLVDTFALYVCESDVRYTMLSILIIAEGVPERMDTKHFPTQLKTIQDVTIYIVYCFHQILDR